MSMHPGTDMERVRHVLARELETISEYEQLSREASDPLVRDFLAHLAAEEKEHVTEAVLVLRRLDPDQDAYFQKDLSPEHFQNAGASAPPASPAQKASPKPSPNGPVPSPSIPDATRERLARAGGELTVGGPHPELPSTPFNADAALHSVPAAPSGHALPFTVGALRRGG